MEAGTNLRWERSNEYSYDLILVSPEAVAGRTKEILEAALEEASALQYCNLPLSSDAVKEFRRWLAEPETPLAEQAYARLSNWFKTYYHYGAARNSDLGRACAKFWDTLFCAKPEHRLTAPLKDHKILSEEFETWWPQQLKCQENSKSRDGNTC